MYTIGIDVGGTNLKAGLVSGTGELVSVRKIPLVWHSPEKLAADLMGLAASLAEEAGVGREQIRSIGMGVPGMVDSREGVILRTVNIPIENVPIAELMGRSWDIPVYLGNDADCAALGEYFHLDGKRADSLILVTLGTGIGTGIILGGHILRGFNGCAGEGGHMVIVPGGEPCTCGRRGCWERYASATGLIRLTREAMERHPDSLLWQLAEGNLENVDGQTAFAAAKAGDGAGRAVAGRYVDYLAEGICNLVNLLQPEVICIGGGISNEDDRWLLEPLRRRVEEWRYDRLASRHTEIVKARLGNDAGIIGAALLGPER